MILLWGSNAREAHPIFFHHVLKAVHAGAPLYVVDPRRTTSAQWTDAWLGLNVGTDIAVANAMAREIIHAGLHNREFIERATTGFEVFVASVEPYTLEYAERESGVPADVIREVAHTYARADRAQICWTLGITEHHNAVDNVLSLINLALLTGNVGRYGSGLNPLRGQNNVQGGGDMGAIPNRLPGFQDMETDDEAREKFDRAWNTTVPPKYGWHMTEMFEAMGRGELTTLYVLGENPVQSDADAHHVRERLEVGLDVLEAGQPVRDRAHVAAALHVVLAAERVEAAAVAPDVAGDEGQVDEPEDVVHGVVVLGDAERPADLGSIRARIGVGDLLDHVGGHPGERLGALERVGLDGGGVGLEARGGAGYELAIVEPREDDLAGHAVRERDVAADVEAEPRVRPLRRRRATRVDRVHAGAVVDRLQDVVEEDRVGLAGVRSPQQDHVRVLDLLI